MSMKTKTMMMIMLIIEIIFDDMEMKKKAH